MRLELTNNEYMYWLCNLKGIGNRKISILLNTFGSAKEVYHAKEDTLRQMRELTEKDRCMLLKNRDLGRIHISYANLLEKGIYFLTKEDNNYPERLKNIYDAPNALYLKGNLLKNEKKTIAIVGARNCSGYGIETARYFARELSKAGLIVISGLARGIDKAAHEGALQVGGSTYAVLGCGIDICYPSENIEVYMKMMENGGILSEYPPGVSPIPGLFPMRNRIISGLADGILVVEAKERSGSLITVDCALDQGKDVFAVPGRIMDGLSEGCHNLIKNGAKIVTKSKDILEEFQLECLNNIQNLKKENNLLETNEKIVYASLSLEPKHIDHIVNETKLSVNEVLGILVKLELMNYTKQLGNNYYTATVG